MKICMAYPANGNDIDAMFVCVTEMMVVFLRRFFVAIDAGISFCRKQSAAYNGIVDDISCFNFFRTNSSPMALCLSAFWGTLVSSLRLFALCALFVSFVFIEHIVYDMLSY